MTLEEVHKWEKAVVMLLNFDEWNLTWSGGSYEHYDAEGFTPKGNKCVIEMKFRTKYYKTKMIEKYKYDKLMEMSDDVVKLYFVNDPKANYLFWLDSITLPTIEELYCPDTTLWTKKRKNKEVYLLEESQATLIQENE